MTWFKSLFGFEEDRLYTATQGRFAVEGPRLRSLANGRDFAIGSFATPSLGELRRRARVAGRPGVTTVKHEVIGDVLELHARAENRGALFQVASQFNCLEFASPTAIPEHGVTGYAQDPTQGPACALAAAAATVYRNYFAPVGGAMGQRLDRQINTLDDLAARLGPPEAFFTIKNGYTFSDATRLTSLSARLAELDRGDLLDSVRIGLQTDVQVTFARRFAEPHRPTRVSQAFCSAVSCAYSRSVDTDDWAPLATLVLDAAYEATLWAAVLDAAEGAGSGKVWLTFVGGGAFGNRPAWIGAAIRRAIATVEGYALDLRIGHYRRVDAELRGWVDGG